MAWAARTRAATTSSTIGPLVLSWTDVDTNASMTYTLAIVSPSGSVSTTNAINLTTVTGSCLWIPMLINTKILSPIIYSLTYASSGATTMQYAFHMRALAL